MPFTSCGTIVSIVQLPLKTYRRIRADMCALLKNGAVSGRGCVCWGCLLTLGPARAGWSPVATHAKTPENVRRIGAQWSWLLVTGYFGSMSNVLRGTLYSQDTSDKRPKMLQRNLTFSAISYDWTGDVIQVLSCFQKAATCDGANVAARLPCVRRSACMFTAKQQLVLERKTMQGVGAIVVARLPCVRMSTCMLQKMVF